VCFGGRENENARSDGQYERWLQNWRTHKMSDENKEIYEVRITRVGDGKVISALTYLTQEVLVKDDGGVK
jgi:hypothetical protein